MDQEEIGAKVLQRGQEILKICVRLKNTSPCILCSHHSNRATAEQVKSLSKLQISPSLFSQTHLTKPLEKHRSTLSLENHRSTRSWLHLFFVWGLVYYGNWVVLLVNLCHFIFLDLWIIEHDDWGFELWLCFVTTCHLGLRKLIHFLHKVGELR